MTYLQAVVIGLIQGLTELFPVSSLGHTVLVPAWLGGSWATLVREESRSESPYLAFVVGLHLATALVLIGYFWRTWLRIVRGLVTSIIRRRVSTEDERLAWLLVIATIPVGLAGLALEHVFRVLFAKPLAAALFLTANGGILFLGERYRRRDERLDTAAPAAAAARQPAGATRPTGPAAGAPAADGPAADGPAAGGPPGAGALLGPPPGHPGPSAPGGEEDPDADRAADARLSRIGPAAALAIGAAQILALFAGISREGVTMVGGLVRGLRHTDALRFSFLLSTPVILAAGALKVPDLAGPLGSGIRGQVLVGSAAAAASSLLAVLFLSRWFRTRTLTPFAVYCLAAGLISVARFGLF
jgi:undecaprenyl-diphosphatase